MKKIFLLLLLSIAWNPTWGSLFLGVGTGGHYSYTSLSEETRNQYFAYNLIGELEYAPRFRYGWMAYSRLEHQEMVSHNFSHKYLGYGMGVKYVKPFQFYKPNLSKTTEEKLGGFALFFPLIYLYDFYLFAIQNVIPSHPFFMADVFFLRDQERNYGWGATLAPGFTTGYLDIKLPVKSAFYDGFERMDKYALYAGLEFTVHFSLGNPVRSEKSLIE